MNCILLLFVFFFCTVPRLMDHLPVRIAGDKKKIWDMYIWNDLARIPIDKYKLDTRTEKKINCMYIINGEAAHRAAECKRVASNCSMGSEKTIITRKIWMFKIKIHPKKMRAKQWKICTTHPTLVLLQKFSRFLRLHWQCFSSFADQKECDSMEIQCFQVALAYQNPERMLKCTPTNTFRLRNSEINVF